MNNIRVLLQKEWLEFRQQRWLVLGIVLVPLILTLIPMVALYGVGHTATTGNTEEVTRALMKVNPALAGMSLLQESQAVMGQVFSIMFLLIPLILPSVIASYSIFQASWTS